jgi:PAS domain S-box-containing protein
MAEVPGQLERTYAELVVGLGDLAVILADVTGRVVGWNLGAERLFGWTSAEMVGNTQDVIFTAEDRAMGAPEQERATARKEGRAVDERWHRRKDGSRLFLSGSMTALLGPQGTLVGFAKVARDTTDRRMAEEGLRESEGRFRFLAGLAEATRELTDPEAVMAAVVRRLGEHLLASRCAYADVDPDEDRFTIAGDYVQGVASTAGDYVLELFGPRAAAEMRGGRTLVIRDVERELAMGEGREMFLAIEVKAIVCCPLVKGGKLTAMMAVHQNEPREWTEREVELVEQVVERSWAYIEQARDHRAVLERERALRELAAELEAANAAKDRFLAVLSHELRTPLTPALALLGELEREGRLSEQGLEDVRTVRRNVELEARLIDDLLDLTRVARGKVHLEMAVADVHAAARQVMEMQGGEAREKGVALSAELSARQHFVKADVARLRQILWNLMRNAVKFTPSGGRVVVRSWNVEREGRAMLVVEVEDTGIGIAPEKLERIFEAFEQAGAEITQRFGGLGLGLAITRTLVELHGGQVRAESAGEGQGARFSVALPVVEETEAAVVAEPRRAEGKGRKLRVLLVEDHGETRRVMSRLLKELGHEVETAGTVQEASEKAREGGYGLLISDLGLPDGSGLEVVRAYREMSRGPAIALSGYGMEEDVKRSLEAGFDVHLTKPVRWERVMEVIEGMEGGGS